jgi:hypothetical protein
MSKNIQTIGINFRDGNGSGGNFGGGSSYHQEERKEAVQTTVPYNPPTFLGNNNMVQPYQSNLGTGSMFGSSGGGYVGAAEYNYTRSNPHVGIGVHNWIPPELEQIQPIQTVATNITQPVVKPVLTQKEIQDKVIADKAAAAHKVEYYARGAAAEVKAKIISQDIAIVQTEEGEKVLNLDNIYLSRDDMSALYCKLTRVSFDLDVMSLENTRIDGYAIKNIFTPAYPDVFHNIVYLNLANNNFGVYGANNIREALTRGEMSATKYIDVSGNNITKRGEGLIIEALQNERVHDMIILTQRFDQNTKMVVGTKEEKAAFFNDLLKQGAEEGLYTVVDTNWWGQAKSDFNEDEVVAKGGAGFIKNKWVSEDIVQSYVKGELIAKLSKDVENLVTKNDDNRSMVSCYVGAAETAWTEVSGRDLALANTNFTDTNMKHLVDLLKLRLPDYQATAQIVEYIAEHENVLLLDKVLSGREIGILGYSLKQTNFDLDIISLQNNDLNSFAVTCIIGSIFANLGHGIVEL